AAQTYKDLGVKRIVLARELTIPEIKRIKDTVKDIEIETFVHGAMCIAYSGRCILSAYMTKEGAGRRKKDKDIPIRSANRGDCSHSCRWEFILKEKSRPEQNYEIFENEEGSYILSSKDICMIDHIKDLIEAGIDSLKIEGRMKSILYISSITRAYRRAIDNYYDDKIIFNRDFFEKELNVVSHREFSTGFFYENPKNQPNITENIAYKREMRLGALVTGINGDRVVLKIYNKITREDKIEYISNDMKTIKVKDIKFYDKEGVSVESVNHTQYVEAEIYDENDNVIPYKVYDILRMESSF
nr:U32 family peptidase [Spirochaetota bacterium]